MLWATRGHDRLFGDTGDDRLHGGAGDDALFGQEDNDTLQDGRGNDPYRVGRGAGRDVIVEDDRTAGNRDSVVLGSTSPLELMLSQQGQDLRIALHGSSDQVTIKGWYKGARYQAEMIQTTDEQTLLNTQVERLIQAMAA